MQETFKGSKVRHGTESGWRKHQELGERQCTPCYQAKAAADKRRRGTPRATLISRARSRAQQRALLMLARQFPARFKILYRSYLREEYSYLEEQVPGITEGKK